MQACPTTPECSRLLLGPLRAVSCFCHCTCYVLLAPPLHTPGPPCAANQVSLQNSNAAEKKAKTLIPSKPHYKDAFVRLCALASVVVTLKDHQPDFDAAAQQFKQVDGGAPAQQVHESRKAFCERWWRNWQHSQNLDDAQRSGRPPIISTADAVKVADLLKQGYWVHADARHGGGERLVGYSTIEQAIEVNADIKQIRDKYDCTPHQLWQAAHRADPDLGRKRICSKHQFSQSELTARMQFARDQLQMLVREPDYLHLLVFADESTTLLHGHDKKSVSVYCSKSSCTFADVCYFNDPKQKTLKAHYYLAVTAHPLFQPAGIVMFDFCSGTDDIHRGINYIQDGDYKDHSYTYQVGSQP